MGSRLEQQLARDEGRSLTAYRDGNGHWTIGIGHLIDLDPNRLIAVPRITRITDAECKAFFDADDKVARANLIQVFTLSTLSNSTLLRQDEDGSPRWRAMVNMMFNRGIERVQNSSTITPAIRAALIGTGTWQAVSDAILASPWCAEIKDRGVRLAKQFETNIDQ